MDKEIIKVTDDKGIERDAEVVLAFEKDDKKYVIYTFNEEDKNGMIILYSSMIIEKDDEIIFEKISKEDWSMVKDIMNKIAKEWKE